MNRCLPFRKQKLALKACTCNGIFFCTIMPTSTLGFYHILLCRAEMWRNTFLNASPPIVNTLRGSVIIYSLCASVAAHSQARAKTQGTNSTKTSVAVHTVREGISSLPVMACAGMSHLGGFLALQFSLSSNYDSI